MAIFDEVRDVVVEQLSVAPDAVKLESKIIEDLGADSLEEKFEVEIPDSEAEKLKTIQDVVTFVEGLKK